MPSRFIAFLICMFLFGCGSVEKAFDYGSVDFTEGLSVEPSALAFVRDNETAFFSLHFSGNDLFLLNIDYSGLGDNFTVNTPLKPNDCRENISASEQGCRIYVSYTPKAPGDQSGFIGLYFMYVKDMGSDKTKEQRLRVTGTN